MIYKKGNDLLGIQKEKRRELRVPLRLVRVNMEARKDVFFGYAKNISASGLFVPTVNPKAVGEKFRLKFALPDSKREIIVTAEVVWNRRFSEAGEYEPGMGIKFIEISDEDADLIREFVDHKRKEK